MPRTKIEVDGYKCIRCGHEWISRGKKKPMTCPKCRSPYWDTPKKEEMEEQKE
jgi:predicted Zn-ribbon and HTH transcriptional regulator